MFTYYKRYNLVKSNFVEISGNSRYDFMFCNLQFCLLNVVYLKIAYVMSSSFLTISFICDCDYMVGNNPLNISGVPDAVSCTNQCVCDIKRNCCESVPDSDCNWLLISRLWVTIISLSFLTDKLTSNHVKCFGFRNTGQTEVPVKPLPWHYPRQRVWLLGLHL